MIPVPSGVRVWLAVGRTDMRRGMTGLALQVQELLHRDPHAGDLFVFRGARGDLIKIIWHDGVGMSLYAKIFVAATRGEPDDPLLLELGIYRIAARLLDRARHGPIQPAQGGLARAAHRRVNDMITAALDDKSVASPTLDQLADAACLSVNHFIRAFHQQTGVTPHRHVVLRRLERGITLLKKPGKSVAEVADGVGFATPAHFVATFRRTMGVTPGAFQSALLTATTIETHAFDGRQSQSHNVPIASVMRVSGAPTRK